MKRITIKILSQEHKDLVAIAQQEDKSITSLLTECINKFILDYIDEDGAIDAIALSKKEAYSVKQESNLITLSFEIDKNIHRIFKHICNKKGIRLKWMVRGIILELIDLEV